MYGELQKRLAILTREELELLVRGDDTEQKALLWFAFCARYALVREWAENVVVPRLRQMDLTISDSDIYAFPSRQAVEHPEIEDLKPSTRTKLVTVLLRPMREACIVSADHVIIPAVLSPRVVDLLLARGSGALSVFPLLSGQIGA